MSLAIGCYLTFFFIETRGQEIEDCTIISFRYTLSESNLKICRVKSHSMRPPRVYDLENTYNDRRMKELPGKRQPKETWILE